MVNSIFIATNQPISYYIHCYYMYVLTN